MSLHQPKIVIAGAAPDTGNLGVTALCYSVLQGILTRLPSAHVTVLDHGRGVREGTYVQDGVSHSFCRVGVWSSRRVHRDESLWNIRIRQKLGLGGRVLESLCSADLVLDITGGDSFTDLYGRKRFQSGAVFKQFVLSSDVPLAFLPQTYGPFREPAHRQTASRLVRGARMAWARDAASYQRLLELLGDDADASIHREGVDVAFGLPSCQPPDGALTDLAARLADSSTIGFNVSGLIWNQPSEAIQRYQLKANYRVVVRRVLAWLLENTDATIVLIPHVNAPESSPESDRVACLGVAEQLRSNRVLVCPTMGDPRSAKWFISMLDWFCGTRMHSTIAALSSRVPSAALAYSDKTLGVFESCDVGSSVVDPRRLTTDAATEALIETWSRRSEHAARLARALPSVLAQADDQLDAILDHLEPVDAHAQRVHA